MTRDELVAQHATRWKFRARGPFEGTQQYVDAVVEFLEGRDWAAAHEVRLGKVQATWTPADVLDFKARFDRRHGPNDEPPIIHPWTVDTQPQPTTLETLYTLTHSALDFLTAKRKAEPLGDLPILAQVVLTDGRVMSTVCSSGNRLGVLVAISRSHMLYGFSLVFDAFVHALELREGKEKATKRDALLAHIGTRDDRHLLQRVYAVQGKTVTFEPEVDTDIRASQASEDPGTINRFMDPYATLFVTVPLGESTH